MPNQRIHSEVQKLRKASAIPQIRPNEERKILDAGVRSEMPLSYAETLKKKSCKQVLRGLL